METFGTTHNTYKENPWNKETNIAEVMNDVKERLRPILQELKSDVEANKIGMILGIDGGGRVPALLLARVLKYKASIETRFVTGNKNVDNEDKIKRLEELIGHFSTDEFKGQLGDREVIIMDDIVASGHSVDLTCQALKRVGIKYRICALAKEASQLSSDISEIEEFLDAKVIVGNTGTPLDDEYPEIYGKHKMAGVKKGVGMHSESIAIQNSKISELVNVDADEADEVLKITREKADQIAQELAIEIGWNIAK